ncbi:MAG: DM13 domain-containing protein [Bacteroidetes bacterium]|nr:DM13 domain-containing protein [Bacteroidota bacterium]
MRYIFSISIISILLIACSKSNYSPTTVINEIPDTVSSSVVYNSEFVSGPFGHVTGIVKIYNDSVTKKLSVALKDFNTSNGPDLHVYLSQESEPIHFIELGKLKSTQGNQVYDVPGNPDFTLYKYVLIHCQEFNHVFGIALLE